MAPLADGGGRFHSEALEKMNVKGGGWEGCVPFRREWTLSSYKRVGRTQGADTHAWRTPRASHVFFGLLLSHSTLLTLKGTQALKDMGLREIMYLSKAT